MITLIRELHANRIIRKFNEITKKNEKKNTPSSIDF